MRNSERRLAGREKEKGFTLLEVLVALSVIAIALLSVVRLQGQTIGLCEAVKFYSAAPFLAQAKMAEKVTETRFPAGEESGDFGPQHEAFAWQAEIMEKRVEPGELPGISVAEIRVRISTQGGRKMTYTISEYHSVKNGGLRP